MNIDRNNITVKYSIEEMLKWRRFYLSWLGGLVEGIQFGKEADCKAVERSQFRTSRMTANVRKPFRKFQSRTSARSQFRASCGASWAFHCKSGRHFEFRRIFESGPQLRCGITYQIDQCDTTVTYRHMLQIDIST